MKRLTLDDISNAPSLPEKEIEIPEWDATVLVTGFSKATPSIVDKILIGIYRCMAWTKEDQASIASEFPE
jgi:lysine/ornithine N-monooxygenase